MGSYDPHRLDNGPNLRPDLDGPDLPKPEKTMKATALYEIRSQRSIGSSAHMFGGPDTYVMVQIVPADVTALVCLNYGAAKRRGIRLIHCGEGYQKNQATGRSMLGAAIAEGVRIEREANALEDPMQWGKDPS